MLAIAFALLLVLPARAQQYSPGYTPYPAYQAGVYQPVQQMPPVQPMLPGPPGWQYAANSATATPLPVGMPYQPPIQQRQPIPAVQSMQPMQPMQPQQPFTQAPDSSYSQNASNLSPYEQQELALKEAKMVRELESMEKSREMSESFRQSDSPDNSLMERGYVQESSYNGGKTGGIRKIFGGVGNAFKSGARVAAPAAASVGTFFIMRAALGQSSY